MTIKASHEPISILPTYDSRVWVTHAEVQSVMGILAPSQRYLARLGSWNPNLKSLKVEMKRNGLRLWKREGVMRWVEKKFRGHPAFVAKVRAELLPQPKATKRRSRK